MRHGAATFVLLTISIALLPVYFCSAAEQLCIFTVDPKILYFEAQGGTDEVTVTPEPGCTFTPRTACHWITLSLSEELGKKTVIVQVDAHHTMAQRSCSDGWKHPGRRCAEGTRLPELVVSNEARVHGRHFGRKTYSAYRFP